MSPTICHSRKQHTPIRVPLLVKNAALTMELDTGAAVTIISEKLYIQGALPRCSAQTIFGSTQDLLRRATLHTGRHGRHCAIRTATTGSGADGCGWRGILLARTELAAASYP